MISNSVIIESISCPITGEVMIDPVQGKDGQTYERSAILMSLSIKLESPITREYMTPTDLKVNASIRFLCDKYHAGELGDNASVKTTPSKISTHDIKVDHSIYKNANNTIMLTFDINKESMPNNLTKGHLSQDVVIVIDHSGSTRSSVEAKDDNGNKLENGMSILDIVNHAARTVVKTLDKNSRLAIVVFDNIIDVLFQLTLMTEMNSSRAIAEISNIKPRGQTNIWHAIEKAIHILNEREDKSRNGSIMMLTDGMPNIKPARGEIETLKRLQRSTIFTSPIYTFGFGYSLERTLLYELAKYGNGSMSHIPDGGMIATVFCHSIATILTTVVINLQLHITYNETINFEQYSPLMGDFAYIINNDDPRNITINLGTIQLGQMRHIIINTSHLTKDFNYYYTYKIGGQSFTSGDKNLDVNSNIGRFTVVDKIGGQSFTSDDKNIDISTITTSNNIVNSNIGRFTVVETIRKIINLEMSRDHEEAKIAFNTLVNYYTSSNMTDKLTLGIIKNLIGKESGEGQFNLAINLAYYTRWGEFYLDQLSRSLNQEIKPNFRDTACPFGGDVFENIVDHASDVFDTLPPPEPSLMKTMTYSSIQPIRTSTLASYNSQNTSTPCFTGDCKITMSDNTQKLVKNIIRGDNVKILSDPYDKNSDTISANVICILETIIEFGLTKLVTLDNGFKITPWHPILLNDKWQFPNEISKVNYEKCNAVYSILLSNGHTMMINNVWCIGLGHNYNDGILKHDYFGTDAIINDLSSLPGWKNGHVVINSNYSIIRDENTGLIKSICGKGKKTITDSDDFSFHNFLLQT